MRASSTARAVEFDQPRRSPVREHRPEFRLFSLEAVRERLRGEAPASRFLDRPFASVQLLLLSMAGLLGFGILMSVSTTIAASHDVNGVGSIWSQAIKEGEFIAIGLLLFWSAMRCSPRAFRFLA